MTSCRVWVVAGILAFSGLFCSGQVSPSPTTSSDPAATQVPAANTGQVPSQNPPASPTGKVDSSKSVELKIDITQPFLFVAMGDLRETDASKHFMSSPERRQAIIHKIAEINPAFVGVSGDLVLSGGSVQDWQQWDRETAEWTAKKIEILPAPGNHDVHADPLLENYFRRFPALRQNRFYSARAGNVLVLSLDSSLPSASGPQFEWLRDKVEHLGKDTDFVVFQMHHPPVTRSEDHLMGGGHSARTQEIALGQWLETKQKTTAAKFVVIAGHVHNYERYERNGITYIVSGGGGATPYIIERAANDVYKDPGASYHYLRIEVNQGRMRIGMEKLEIEDGHPVWNERDWVTLMGPSAPEAVKTTAPVPKEQGKP